MTERTPTRLLVNADDLAWSRSVNAGIVEAYQGGIVTSTSLLAAGHAFDDAIRLLAENPGLTVGVHLNIYRGEPVLPPDAVSTLLGDDGRFPGDWKVTARRLALDEIDLAQVEAEFSAAVEKVIAAGVRPAHLDSEKHLHQWPSIFDVVCRVAVRYEIPRVRVVREPFTTKAIPAALSLLGLRNAAHARAMGLSVADATIGVTESPIDRDTLARLLAGARAANVEFVCHPGHVDEEFLAMQASITNKMVESREAELATMCGADAKRSVADAGCELCARL